MCLFQVRWHNSQDWTCFFFFLLLPLGVAPACPLSHQPPSARLLSLAIHEAPLWVSSFSSCLAALPALSLYQPWSLHLSLPHFNLSFFLPSYLWAGTRSKPTKPPVDGLNVCVPIVLLCKDKHPYGAGSEMDTCLRQTLSIWCPRNNSRLTDSQQRLHKAIIVPSW